ncbi:hypothetical protein SLEP1_g31022 [Rubroshorea leprosula]|uniref:Uncharacterized protein n=1 Tax=Rubroshorea leprosula TaxID=152421 RepID=A0AAV5K9T5_9ROSI|nr:hypothetical protein SLEP1_g31022 [Rubroshorea leprosula]
MEDSLIIPFALDMGLLGFTLQLVKTGLEDDVVFSLIIFSLQYILVNHEYWKYKMKNTRWKVTLKVLELVKTCIAAVSFSGKLEAVKDLLLCDSSIHNVLFRIVCTTTEALEKLYVNRLVELTEIEGLQLAISSALDVLYVMLSKFSKDISLNLPIFHQALLSSTTKPIPVVAAVISLISYFRDPAIQLGAAKVLSMLLCMADYLQPYLFGNACFGLDDKQIADLKHSVCCVLLEQVVLNEDLFVAFVNLLTSAAHYQPAFLVAIFSTKEDLDVQLTNAADLKQPRNGSSSGAPGVLKSGLMAAFLHYIERSDDLINSNPRILLSVLNLLKALWQGAGHYTAVLEQLKNSENFWRHLSNSISRVTNFEAPPIKSLTESEALNLGYKYKCQSTILEIMAYDMFMKKKLLYVESLVKEDTESSEKAKSAVNSEKSKTINGYDLEDVFLNWSESSLLGSLIKSYTSCEYDNEVLYQAKVSVSLVVVHVMGRLSSDNTGSMSVSLVEKVHNLSKKLFSQLAFSELMVGYSRHGYSEGRELKALIISDLYYHLQGELEGRKISPGPFKELSQFLIESEFLQMYEGKYNGDLFATAEDLHLLFDLERIRADLGIDMWDYSEWKASKSIADTMLCCLQDTNSMISITSSKLRVLKALINVYAVYKDDLLLMLSLLALEFSCVNSDLGEINDKENGEGFAEVSNISLGLLPILCNTISIAECCTLSLTAVDLILKRFLTANTWFPIMQKHLQLQFLVLKLQEKNSVASFPIILKFFLTIASVRGGAEMLLNAGFLSCLRVLFADLSDGRPSSVINTGNSSLTSSDKLEKPQQIWGLGLAVVTAVVRSLGDSSPSIDVVDNVIRYLFSEKANLIFYYLSAPEFPSDDRDKKRPRAQRTQTSLTSLKDTEHTLMLMCVLARHWSLWTKAMKDMDSPLREISIHLLAFISQGTQRLGESPSRTPPLLCPPILKEELDCRKKPSFVNSRNGWFALSPLGCVTKPKPSMGSTTSALVIKDQAAENINHISQTYFSDSVAIQIYKITFLLLKFLCFHAKGAAKRAEELGFVDLAHFPELPMPEILHGLQDQAISIVIELCETNRLKQIHSEVQFVCLLLIQIMEMALYLELCVLQICGIRPVLGRVEDFSKEIKLLMNATEGHAFLKTSVRSLKQIISLVYPGLV